MLYYNFKRIFKARGIERPYSFLVDAGFSDHFATRTKNNRIKQLRMKEMEKLCLALRCTPNDLMEWEPEASKNHDPEQPLNRIIKSNKAQDLIKTIYSAPPGYLPSLEKKILEELEKLEG